MSDTSLAAGYRGASDVGEPRSKGIWSEYLLPTSLPILGIVILWLFAVWCAFAFR
jgi:hypothetical protein